MKIEYYKKVVKGASQISVFNEQLLESTENCTKDVDAIFLKEMGRASSK